jgi:hypothetical protein
MPQWMLYSIAAFEAVGLFRKGLEWAKSFDNKLSIIIKLPFNKVKD